MISQNDLETELRTILEQVRRMRPPFGGQPHAFHEDKGEVARHVQELIDKVRGIAQREAQKLTSAEIRHAARLPR